MSTEDEVRQIVINITRTDFSHITRETDLKQIKADSLDVMQIVSVIEDKYGIEFSDDVMSELITFGDIVSHAEEKLKAKV